MEYGARSGGAEKVRSANAELGKNPMAVSPDGRIRGWREVRTRRERKDLVFSSRNGAARDGRPYRGEL